jgi:hypothetical protein
VAKVYARVGGKPLTKVIALHRDVQSRIDDETEFYALKADGLLRARAKNRTNDSEITVDRGDVDGYVVLDDSRGLDAALTIEYGRKGEMDPETGEWKGASEGLWVLHDAFGLRDPRKLSRRPKKGGASFDD